MKNFKIRKKLIVTFGIVLILFVERTIHLMYI